jgi:ATP-dependent DNA helicase RecQ
VAKVLPLDNASGEESSLFEALRELRLKLAQQEAIPPYIVMSDKVLHQLVMVHPVTLEGFGLISGIGEYKKNKYGKDFIAVIKKFY